jgi:hypothetical protein
MPGDATFGNRVFRRSRNQVRFAGAQAAIPMLAEPTSAQREAFDLIGVPIPLTMK